MPIKKKEFYEGAALHMLASTGGFEVRHAPPFFVLDGSLILHLKYSTRNRSPWNFTFVPDEQTLLNKRARKSDLILGLICGNDGVVAVDYADYLCVAPVRSTPLGISCHRSHGEHYEVRGPEGSLDAKIPPSSWRTILMRRKAK